MLTWAGLLVLVLYSPFGSPELYKQNKIVVYQEGVDFSNRDIANAKGIKNASGNSSGITVPEYTQESKSSTYNVSNSTNNSNGGGPINPDFGDNNTSQSSQNSGLDGDPGFIGSMGKSKSSNQSLQSGQYLSLMSDISPNGVNKPFQGTEGGVGPLTGTTDPGGDPTGPPIPISDGWGFLILLSVVYIILKRYIFN